MSHPPPDVTFEVLGPFVARDRQGVSLELRGPRHRAVLARLLVARGAVVPVGRLVADLWLDPPAGAVGAIQTFVAALRRALEPERPPRAPARILVTEPAGYRLCVPDDAVDAWRFEASVAAASGLAPHARVAALDDALALWRGPAYLELPDDDWARIEAARLSELRLLAVERRAEARLATGAAGEAVAELDAHAAEHPWREDAWRLLSLALYRCGRQTEALAVLRRAGVRLREEVGVAPGPALRRLEHDILHHAEHLMGPADGASPVEQVWSRAARSYEHAVPVAAPERLQASVTLLRALAVSGPAGLRAARTHRVEAISAAEAMGDPRLTARVIASYDVPAVWMRSDDPAQAAQVVAAARRALAALGDDLPAVRARLLAIVALETRGVRDDRAAAAAADAEALARRLGDPPVLALALNAAFMQSARVPGAAGRRDAIGAELIALAERHDLASFEVLGHLVRMQARAGLADLTAADGHADAADRLAAIHGRPLAGVFTAGYRALRAMEDAGATPELALAAYRRPLELLDGAEMPGLRHGLRALTRLVVELRFGVAVSVRADDEWGPYLDWAAPLLLLAEGRPDEAAAALRRVPEPPPDLMQELLWCLTATAAIGLGEHAAMRRAYHALKPCAGQPAGAGSGLLSLGPVDEHLARLEANGAR